MRRVLQEDSFLDRLAVALQLPQHASVTLVSGVSSFWLAMIAIVFAALLQAQFPAMFCPAAEASSTSASSAGAGGELFQHL